MSDRAETLVAEWVARPDHTARSVLVTIFGDTILPVATGIWLSQLFTLTDVFGFSDRLVRTSIYRLSNEGWLTSERSGRQSRYELTDQARAETDEASARIYQSVSSDWSGEWCLVFLDAPHLDPELRDRLKRHLGWHGFAPLGRGVVAAPGRAPDRARELCRSVAPSAHVPMGVLEFSELDAVVADGFFDTTFGLDDLAAAFAAFVDFHQRVDTSVETVVEERDGATAFALRTMLIHDLRRIRLRSADVPVELLPTDWPGADADRLAASLYTTLGSTAAPWLSGVLEVEYPARIPGRFDATS